MDINNIMDLDIFEEKSHGKLLFEFRYVIGENDGHLYKIVYNLNKDNITSNNMRSDDKSMKDLKSNIKSKGTNYTSRGNIVKAIVDMSTNKRVNQVNAFPPIHNIGGSISPTTIDGYMKIMRIFIDDRNELSKIQKELEEECPTGIVPNPGFKHAIKESKKRGQNPILYKVGEIDDTDTYKTVKPRSVLKMLNLESNFKEEDNINMDYMESVMGKVKDGYMCELPEDLQKKIMEVNKIINAEVNDLIKDDKYQDLHNSRWAMSCLDDFCTKPSPKDGIGSFRLYQKKKTYECMIQVTGHFKNYQYGWIEDLLNSFIRDLFQRVKPIIRKKFDMTLKSEGEHGNPEEGFDLYPNKKEAEALWNKFEDKKIKALKESTNFMDEEIESFEEKSHSKLKYDFRKAIDAKTGHSVKIVYDINTLFDLTNGTKERKKYGDTDHVSKDQKVLAIIDEVTGEKLNEVETKSVLFFNNGQNGETIKVGMYDPNPRYKSTYWPKNSEPTVANTTEGIAIREKNRHMRGSTVRNINYDFNVAPAFMRLLKKGEVPSKEEVEKYINGLQISINHIKKELRWLDPDDEKDEKEIKELNGKIKKYENQISFIQNKYLESKVLTEGFFDSLTKKNQLIEFQKLPEGLRNLVKDTRVDLLNVVYDYIESNNLDVQPNCNIRFYMDQEDSSQNTISISTIIDFIFGRNNVEDFGLDYDPQSFITIIEDGLLHTIITPPLSFLGWDMNRINPEIISLVNKILMSSVNKISSNFSKSNPGKSLVTFFDDNSQNKGNIYIAILYDEKYSTKLANYVTDPKNYPLTEATEQDEENGEVENYNTEMTEKEAKKTLRSLCNTIISNNEEGEAGKGKNKVSQYTANIFANIITKNLLPKWAPSFKKFSITLDSYQSFYTVEFKTPSMSQDFISRYVDGKEPLNAFLHRIPEIKLRMSPRVFHTMKNPDDAFNFFKAAIQYYDHNVERYSKNLMGEVFKLNHNMKHLIGTTKLSAIVTIPLKLLFVFEDVHMDDKNTFKISSEDISTISKFVKNIYTSYAAPEKEKKKIIDDMKNIVKELREKCEADDDFANFSCIIEGVESFLSGKYDSEMGIIDKKWISENVDIESMKAADHQTSVLYERFGVKKLKKIPSDLIAYITIEAESIKDANDKMMIASYCCSKIEIVEWYIELLEVGSKKYVVPHTKPYLENIRTQLLQCYKKIMNTPIPKQDRAIISVGYPQGYEG